ncbi:hypothetical protein ACFL5P_00600 [candidate division KSB1 bacterium]
MDQVIPTPDVLPIPAPDWLFLFLLIFTFLIHLVFMNCLFGGTIYAAISYIKGKKDPNSAYLSQKMFNFMPVVIAFAVNFGVAPLLFAQTLYGHLLYSSSILMANYWFAIVPMIITGYYGAYLLKFKWDKLKKSHIYVTSGVALIFSAVAFMFVNNMTLMLTPQEWFEHYFKNPATGSLNWGDMQIYPRYIHMLLGAVSVSGVWIMIIGARRKTGDAEWSDWAVKKGYKVFLWATMINILIGVWFLLAIPGNIAMSFLGRDAAATITFVFSLVLLAAAIIYLRKASKSPENIRSTFYGAGFLLGVLTLMIIMRHQLRAFYLEPVFTLDQLHSEPQWMAFSIFAVFLVIGFAAAGYMIRVVLKSN